MYTITGAALHVGRIQQLMYTITGAADVYDHVAFSTQESHEGLLQTRIMMEYTSSTSSMFRIFPPQVQLLDDLGHPTADVRSLERAVAFRAARPPAHGYYDGIHVELVQEAAARLRHRLRRGNRKCGAGVGVVMSSRGCRVVRGGTSLMCLLSYQRAGLWVVVPRGVAKVSR